VETLDSCFFVSAGINPVSLALGAAPGSAGAGSTGTERRGDGSVVVTAGENFPSISDRVFLLHSTYFESTTF
jgi:hypothetical protein